MLVSFSLMLKNCESYGERKKNRFYGLSMVEEKEKKRKDWRGSKIRGRNEKDKNKWESGIGNVSRVKNRAGDWGRGSGSSKYSTRRS